MFATKNLPAEGLQQGEFCCAFGALNFGLSRSLSPCHVERWTVNTPFTKRIKWCYLVEHHYCVWVSLVPLHLVCFLVIVRELHLARRWNNSKLGRVPGRGEAWIVVCCCWCRVVEFIAGQQSLQRLLDQWVNGWNFASFREWVVNLDQAIALAIARAQTVCWKLNPNRRREINSNWKPANGGSAGAVKVISIFWEHWGKARRQNDSILWTEEFSISQRERSWGYRRWSR